MTGCLNGGSCLFGNENETFSCSCKQPWSGEKCGGKAFGFGSRSIDARFSEFPVQNRMKYIVISEKYISKTLVRFPGLSFSPEIQKYRKFSVPFRASHFGPK